MASITSLPNELLLKVFTYLNVSDIVLNVANVCSHWYALAYDPFFWNGLEFKVDKDMELSYILVVLPHLSQLKFLNLQWRTDSPDILDALCASCPNMTGIRLVCCGFLNRGCVRQLFEYYKNLECLSLGKSWAVPSQCLDDIVLLTNLTSLNLANSLLTPEQLRAISLNCTKLVSLNIDYVRGVSEQNLTDFITPRIFSLESLSVFGELLTDNIFQHIELCSKIKLLHISTSRAFTDVCFKSICKLKHLRSLTLRKAVKFSSKMLFQFYSDSETLQHFSHLYISAKRDVTNDDVSIWLNKSSNIEVSLISQYCTCILTKQGFNVKRAQQ